MVEDKEILVNWAEMRQSRLRLRSASKMAKANDNEFQLRVLHNGRDYYAKLKVFPDSIHIIPDDMEIDATMFFEGHFRGAQPVIDKDRKIFQLQFNFKNLNRSPLILVVKEDKLEQLESAVSGLFGASTEYDENEIMEEAKE